MKFPICLIILTIWLCYVWQYMYCVKNVYFCYSIVNNWYVYLLINLLLDSWLVGLCNDLHTVWVDQGELWWPYCWATRISANQPGWYALINKRSTICTNRNNGLNFSSCLKGHWREIYSGGGGQEKGEKRTAD